jgi:group I intron endonuclease
MRRRFNSHLSGSTTLSKAMKKYGKNNFSLVKLDEASTQAELNCKELFWAKELNTLSPNGYNVTIPGNCPLYPEEHKKLLSEAHKGKKLSEEHKKNISKSLKNAKTDHWKGKTLSESHKANISLGHKQSEKNYFKTEEWKERRKQFPTKVTKVLCVENNTVYFSITEAAKQLKCNRNSIHHILAGTVKKTKNNLTFVRVEK